MPDFLQSARGPDPDLAMRLIRSRPELVAARQRATERQALEAMLCEKLRGRDTWVLPGFCQLCRTAVEFLGDWQASDGDTINFREHLVCPSCQLNNRQRFMGRLLESVIVSRGARSASAYLFEQVTPFFSWGTSSLAVAEIVGSEYLGPDVAGGTVIEGVRHEDALALSFDDASFDVIVSNDVFEHVPDVDRSLSECARVLRPDGVLLFSIPFHETSDHTVQRARMKDGRMEELLPPEYHANPISPEGSLVFYDHGWDILDRCSAAGFPRTYLVGYWSLLYGYLGGGLQLVFVAERGAGLTEESRHSTLGVPADSTASVVR